MENCTNSYKAITWLPLKLKCPKKTNPTLPYHRPKLNPQQVLDHSPVTNNSNFDIYALLTQQNHEFSLMSWVYKCHTIELIPQDMKLVQILLFSFIQSYIIMSSATTATAADTADAATSTQTNVFAIGRYKTVLQTVETRSCTTKSTLAVPPPKPLLIARPSEAGEYPILVLLHGYLLYNSFYSQLIQHIASHGFIVIAPQASLSLSLSRMHNFVQSNA